MKGRVKSYSKSHGYGFITDGNVDFRFTGKDWNYRLPPTEGLEVAFFPVATEKGMKATKIRRVKDV